ncbi:TIGR01841 family phasin [Glaciimonas sp. PCH181]|uniref:TIGR01841 family phasin n=1 Tax=Glaciimonas sp. PCH181 TaxID=2133943 RepID=UPI000D39676B|nr:TIGR01841 family phasin [Glaciimonas sp. PCH181]PUA20217.1 hypothetical protein C7W93_10695 [Glaciimonas sp. PCH181]
MMLSNGLYSAAIKDFFESQYALSKTLTEATMGCAEEVIALNIQAVKSRLADTTQFTQELMAAKDQQERLTLTTARLQGRVEKTLALGRQMAAATTKAQTTFSSEIHRYVEESKRSVGSMMEHPDNTASEGFQSALGVMKTAMETAHNGVVQFNQATREAAGKMASVAIVFSVVPEAEDTAINKK